MTTNRVNVSHLFQICPANNMDWLWYLNEMTKPANMTLTNETRIYLDSGEESSLRAICDILNQTKVEDVVNYFMAHLAYSYLHRISTSQKRSNCLSQVHKVLPEALEYFYIKDIFDARRRDLVSPNW